MVPFVSFARLLGPALLCIASSRLATGNSQTDRPPGHGQPSISLRSFEPEVVKRRCMAGAGDFGAAVESGAARACGSMARAVEAPTCVAPADWMRQMQVRAAAWPIGGSITPGCRDLIALSRPAKLRRRDQGCTNQTSSSTYCRYYKYLLK